MNPEAAPAKNVHFTCADLSYPNSAEVILPTSLIYAGTSTGLAKTLDTTYDAGNTIERAGFSYSGLQMGMVPGQGTPE